MLAVISPAKKLDFDSAIDPPALTRPALKPETLELARVARGLTRQDLRRLMGISETLADLNYKRFQDFAPEETERNARPAALAFAGDTYQGLDAGSLTGADLAYAQDHLRILSGLYGLLRPLDLIQPYRLEMGTKLPAGSAPDLYGFWGDRIAAELSRVLGGHDSPVLVNLASNEYFKAVSPKALDATVLTCVFKERRDGQARVISFLAKKARGAMARYMVTERVDRPDGLKDFAWDGYRFQPADSDGTRFVFIRTG